VIIDTADADFITNTNVFRSALKQVGKKMQEIGVEIILNETLLQINSLPQFKPVPLIEQLESIENILITLSQESILLVLIMTNSSQIN
jgi:hypothetical protein